MAYSSSFCSFHSEKELISFCLLAANSAEALLDLWASFWLNLMLYFFKFFLISFICSFDSRVGGLKQTQDKFKVFRDDFHGKGLLKICPKKKYVLKKNMS